MSVTSCSGEPIGAICDMNASRVINELFANADNKFIQSAISLEEGEFLRSFAGKPQVRNTVETGCANGVSSLFICAGLQEKPDAHHVIVDPFQTTEYASRGINALRRANITSFELIEKGSEIALPQLLEQGRTFDLAFIDGYHTFDHALIDFYYSDRMLAVNGYLIFDDCNAPQLMKLCHYISTYPNYRIVAGCGSRGIRRRILNAMKVSSGVLLSPFTRLAGDHLCHEFLDDSVIHPGRALKLENYTMLAFQKVDEYRRPSTWYKFL